MQESDVHADSSQPVSPAAPRDEASHVPRPRPCTEILNEPVDMPLARLVTLTAAAPKDSVTLTLDTLLPLVTATRRLPIDPCPT